jgi:hypothetical protein
VLSLIAFTYATIDRALVGLEIFEDRLHVRDAAAWRISFVKAVEFNHDRFPDQRLQTHLIPDVYVRFL